MKTEAELIDRILKGEWRNYAILVDKYEAKVFNYVNYLMSSREDAEEIVQDTFVKAYRSLSQCRGDASCSTWLIRSDHNNCLTFCRKKRPEKVSLDNVSDTDAAGADPSAVMELDNLQQVLRVVLENLRTDERPAVTLVYSQGLSVQEIRDGTDLSRSNVTILLHTSRKKLLKTLREKGVQQSTL